MSNYRRSTRVCAINEIQPALYAELSKYFQLHELGDIQTETVLCCETSAEKKDENPFSAWMNGSIDNIVYTAVVLTSKSLVWARMGDQSGTRASGAWLQNIGVKLNVSIFSRDTGLIINGLVDNSKTNIRGTIAFGPEEAGTNFCNEVQKFILALNPPRTSKWPTWFGGQ